MAVRFNSVKPLIIAGSLILNSQQILLTPFSVNRRVLLSAAPAAQMANTSTTTTKLIDSHLHVWASPKEVRHLFFFFNNYAVRANFCNNLGLFLSLRNCHKTDGPLCQRMHKMSDQFEYFFFCQAGGSLNRQVGS